MDRRTVATSLAAVALAGVATARAETKAPVGARPSFVDTDDGASLFYLDWGSGKPVLFTHAWALNADIWEYQLTELVDQGLRCIAYDRRGHGRSNDPGRGYDYDRLADDLAAVIERLDLRDITLVGFSMGNGEAVRYLARHGSSRIARLVMVSPIPPEPGRSFDALVAGLKQDRPAFFAKGVMAFTGGHPAVSPAMTDWVREQFMRSSPKAIIECLRILGRGDFEAELRAVTVPTMVVHGEKDQVNPLERGGKKVAALIPGAVLKVYEGGPHGLPISHREQLARDILAFSRG
jgi:pimeloyl-ACP methyl ester carboxylesterase